MSNEKYYIDRAPIMEFIVGGLNGRDPMKNLGHDGIRILTELEFAPKADVVEVTHGRWLDIQLDPIWRSMLATCSHCRARGEVRVKSNECGFAVPDSDHCPHCGAKMDGNIVAICDEAWRFQFLPIVKKEG